MFEECLCGVSRTDINVDDIQLPRRADQFVCRQAAFYAQVVVDMYLDPLLWDMGTPLTHVVRYWCPVLARIGVRLGWATWDVGGGGTIYQWQELNPAELSHCHYRTSGLNGDCSLKHDYPTSEWRLVPLGRWN